MKSSSDQSLRQDIIHKVQQALYEQGIVNIAAIAEVLQQRYPAQEAIELEKLVLGHASLISAPVIFDRTLSRLERTIGDDDQGLIIEIVEGDPDSLAN
ncbi:MAG TPA: hypothetical protein VNS34_28495 [Rhizobiaceae bacterium]|nr:hypothetical protein [Rhizobiaceae bacterium]